MEKEAEKLVPFVSLAGLVELGREYYFDGKITLAEKISKQVCRILDRCHPPGGGSAGGGGEIIPFPGNEGGAVHFESLPPELLLVGGAALAALLYLGGRRAIA